ncbi:HIT domain-containing protein [Rhizobiales bacterium RZME27]|jgi:histidine triad (HIT) family protein|uniref:HIT domain-containing protein n=1 Tax=Endobacterium cereale TaxID=2663029 RepID=A0A6A8A354_9HYPH|nr:HIT family protein [Endobacterium cereale]MEB2843682.1 HIT family protein [Endobacterium cereale]MQY45575.1 HIT domain-containing protein [Endobacterium cereale]
MSGIAYDDGNIFAKILRGEIPCHRVYEDADTLAFMDVMPQAPGHLLVIPKQPSRNMLDADPAVLAKTIAVVQKLARAAQDAFDADGIYIAQFNEPAAGQTVFHLHFHIVPRHEGEALKPHSGKMEDNEILATNAEKIIGELGN